MSPRALLLALLACACIDLDLDADLEGPRLVGGDLPGPRSVEVPVGGPLVLRFSEALDPARLHLALVAWPTVGSCAATRPGVRRMPMPSTLPMMTASPKPTPRIRKRPLG